MFADGAALGRNWGHFGRPERPGLLFLNYYPGPLGDWLGGGPPRSADVEVPEVAIVSEAPPHHLGKSVGYFEGRGKSVVGSVAFCCQRNLCGDAV